MKEIEKAHDFRQCWTCCHLVHDVAINARRCQLTGKTMSKADSYRPTLCTTWKQDADLKVIYG